MASEVPVDGSAASRTATGADDAAAAQPRPAGLDKPTESVVRCCTGTVRSGAPCHRVALPGTMPARCEFHRGQRAPTPAPPAPPTPLSQVLRAGGGAGAGKGGNPLAATPAPPKKAEPEPEPCPARDQARASKSASPPPPPPAPDWLLPDDPTRADAERYLIGCLNAMAVGALDARAVTVALQVLGRLLPAGEAAGPDADQ